MSSRRSLERARSGETRTTEKSEVPPPIVGDQRDFLGADAALIVERGGDRLELEGDVRKTRGPGRRLKLALRRRVGRGVVVDEERGAPDHHVGRRFTEGLAGRRSQEPEKCRDDVAEGMAFVPDSRPLLEKPGAEHAFDRAQVAARLAREIAAERFVAEGGRMVVEAEEQGGRDRCRAVLDRQQTRPIGVADANRGVRSAKVDAARERHARSIPIA